MRNDVQRGFILDGFPSLSPMVRKSIEQDMDSVKAFCER